MAVKLLLNCAISLDGCLARADNTQTRLSNLADRCRVQALRAWAAAVVVGSGTVVSDDPHLTVKPALVQRWRALTEREPDLAAWGRAPRPAWEPYLTDEHALSTLQAELADLAGRRADGLDPGELAVARRLWELNPLRVVLDGQGRTSRRAQVVDARARTLIFTNQLGSVQLWGRFADWPNVEVVLMDRAGAQTGVDLEAACKLLVSRGLGPVLVEGGSRLNGSLLAGGRFDHLELFMRPLLLGPAGVPLARPLKGRTPLEVSLRLENSCPLPALGSGDWEGLLMRFSPLA